MPSRDCAPVGGESPFPGMAYLPLWIAFKAYQVAQKIPGVRGQRPRFGFLQKPVLSLSCSEALQGCNFVSYTGALEGIERTLTKRPLTV